MNPIKKIRIEKRIKQEYIAKGMNVTVATVSRWESGEFLPRADKLPALAKILKCNVSELLTEEQEAANGQ